MISSQEWIRHFERNALEQRVNWSQPANISEAELAEILPSLQAWQLGETSDGANLIKAADRYSAAIGDPDYPAAIRLFIREEQKHGENLGRYLDRIARPRITKNWGDTLFRRVRYFNTSMEMWTLAVIIVESTAQIFYQSVKDATRCTLLKEICTDILIDEAYHITFQAERLAMIYHKKSLPAQRFRDPVYRYAFRAIALTVWYAHRRVFSAGGNTFPSFMRKMERKYRKLQRQLNTLPALQPA
ncbi:MAG: ferritin-like domain-containing protein [Mucilaginibacter polytrichastri]|nr:ferritin-like domain-containing protein [Mucilaginibacter polytrichastri]